MQWSVMKSSIKSVKERFFIERFTSEVEPDLIKHFLVFNPSKISLYGFFNHISWN